MSDLIVIGGGEHARVIIDAARSVTGRWHVVGFLDRAACEETVSRLSILRLGTGDEARSIVERYPTAMFVIGVGAISNPDLRQSIAARFTEAGGRWATIIHRDASVSPSAVIGEGSVVFAQSVVNTGAVVGQHCVINSGAVVEHDVTVGDFSQIAPAAALGGGARVGANSYVGLGSRVRDHVSVGSRVTVGMGSVVVNHVADGCEVMGVPARSRTKEE